MITLLPKPKPLTAAQLNCAERYKTNKMLHHREQWMKYYEARAELAIAELEHATEFGYDRSRVYKALIELKLNSEGL